LKELGDSRRPATYEVILVAPTWRKVCKFMDSADLLKTEYARAWLGLLNSIELKQFADRQGLKIVFLPHPTAVNLLSGELPPHVSSVLYDNCDVQKLLTRAAALVTDYSSINFDSAYIERPVVYFQFDRGEFLGGGHTWRQGYFDYFHDGFGPVCSSLQEVVDALVQLAECRFVMPDKYNDRVHTIFPRRDGQCCERVTAAVEALKS
jgi:CDP-glycerol glycerophosphotransferase (TagB/SpsB family)